MNPDLAGNLISTKFGGKTVAYTRDSAGAVTEIACPVPRQRFARPSDPPKSGGF